MTTIVFSSFGVSELSKKHTPLAAVLLDSQGKSIHISVVRSESSRTEALRPVLHPGG